MTTRIFLYTLALHALLPGALLHLLWRARKQPEYLRYLGERFGFYRSPAATAPVIWIHAVSVGETRAAQPLIKALRERYPTARILLTHTTPTGRATSEALFAAAVERVYLPYDLPWAVRRFLNHFRPQIGLLMETELWPNLVAACRSRQVPLLLVNARLSEKSARRYARLAALTRETLTGLTAIAAQSDADGARLKALGAPRVEVVGNLKFDVTPPAKLEDFRSRLGARRVFLCASTREGEEALILDAWSKASSADTLKLGAGGTATSAPLLVIVPRHPQRFDEVAKQIEARGLQFQRRSDERSVAATTKVWLGDSMGELLAYYAAADVAFVGGSLLDYGCQNLIEACAMGVPVLIGPSTFNFAEAARNALDCGAARQCADAHELVAVALGLLADEKLRREMGHAGRAFAAAHRGATARTLALIERYMPVPA